MKRHFSLQPQCGLTLMELLLAMAIAVLLVGVVFMIYGTAVNTLRTQRIWREALEPAEDALDVLQRDLRCALVPLGITNLPFVLHPAKEGRPDTMALCLFTARAGEGSNDWRAYGIDKVEYSLRAQNGTSAVALIRQCRPFRISAAASGPAEATLLPSLAGLQIQVYDGTEWTNAWEAASGVPQAARIILQLELPSGPRTLAAEILIPAGHRIQAPTEAGKPNLRFPSPETNAGCARNPKRETG